MRANLWVIVGAAALGVVGGAASRAAADEVSERAAAILLFPKVAVEHLSTDVTETAGLLSTDYRRDTLFQISNTSDSPVELKCFYVDATSRCSVSQTACNQDRGLHCPIDAELCLPFWSETDFRVIITPHQPLVWVASAGLSRDDVPLDGTIGKGIGGSSNAGTAIPPIAPVEVFFVDVPGATVHAFDTYQGELKCVVVDGEGHGIPRNDVIGQATVMDVISTLTPTGAAPLQSQVFDAEQYNAVGIEADGGDVNQDDVLVLGGDAGEYNPCPSVLVMDHFFDFAPLPGAPELSVGNPASVVTLIPCTEDIRAQVPTHLTVQFLVFNEFEQRFSSSNPLDCYYQRPLSLIDTAARDRSIFSAFIAGTLTGQTRIRGVNGGVVGVLEQHLITTERGAGGSSFETGFLSGIRNLHRQGDRTAADRVTLP